MRKVLVCLIFLSFLACRKDLESTKKGLEGEVSFGIFATSKANEAENTDDETDEIDTKEFSVQVENTRGELLRKWEKAQEVPQKLKFSVGRFVMRAYSGDSTAQGFSLPSYSGSARFEVKYNETTAINVVCRNNKTLVSIVPEQGFLDYYKDFKTEVSTTEGPLVYVKGETRIGYFVPEDIKVKLFITRPDNSKFEATMPDIGGVKPNDHYIVKISVGSGAGSVKFSVVIAQTNDIVSEYNVPLNAVNGKAPYFIPTGIDLNYPTVQVPESQSVNAKLLIKAGATIDECIVELSSGFLVGKLGVTKFDLARVDGDIALSNKLKELGLKWSHNMRGVSMGEIDFTEFVKNLPALAGNKPLEHILKITVRDYINRTTDVLPLKFIVNPPRMEISRVTKVEKTDGDTKLAITFETEIENALEDYTQLEGIYYKLGNSNYTKVTSFQQNGNQFTISDILKGEFTSVIVMLKYKTPFFERQSKDAYAYVVSPKFVLNPVTTKTDMSLSLDVVGSELDAITDGFNEQNLKLYYYNQGDWEKIETNVETTYNQDTKTKTFNLKGLTPSESYRFKAMYDDKYNSYNDQKVQTDGFSFEETWSQIFSINMNKGGAYGGGWSSKKQDTETVTCNDISNTSLWKTSNPTTANSDAPIKNTWFIVPSAFQTPGSKNNGILLRSVAFSSNNSVAINDNVASWPSGATSKGDVPVPAFVPANNYAAGKATATMKLRSRPYGVVGSFKFIPYNPDKSSIMAIDKSSITATVYDESNKKIGEGKIVLDTKVANWTNFEIIITYSTSGKAAKMEIICASSAGDPSSIALEFDKNRCTALGNELYVDEINLKY